MKSAKENKLFYYLPFAATLALFFTGVEFSLCALFIITFSAVLMLRRTNRAIANWLLFGFLLRVAVAMLDRYLGLTHYEWDDYYSIALQLKANLLRGVPLFNGVHESVHGLAYAVIGAFLYYIFGDYQILMRLLNCFWGALVADRVYSLTIELSGDKRTALTATLVTLFFPSFIMFCSLDMRDAVIFFLTAELLYRISRLMSGKQMRDIIILGAEMVALYFLRTQYLILFTIITMTYWFMRSNLYRNSAQRWAVIIVLLLVVWLGYRYLQDMGFFPVLFKTVNADMAWRTAGGSAYLSGVSYESWWDVVRWMPVRMIHFALGPFFWNVNNVFLLLGAIESMILVAIVALAFSREARQIYNRHPRLYLFLLLFAVMGLFSSAVIDSNYGTAIRHKMNFIFIFFIFSATYLKNVRLRIN
jgi:hypothetical protein